MSFAVDAMRLLAMAAELLYVGRLSNTVFNISCTSTCDEMRRGGEVVKSVWPYRGQRRVVRVRRHFQSSTQFRYNVRESTSGGIQEDIGAVQAEAFKRNHHGAPTLAQHREPGPSVHIDIESPQLTKIQGNKADHIITCSHSSSACGVHTRTGH